MTLASNPGFTVIGQVGPLFIGCILDYLLTGILIHQLYDYNKNYPEDNLAMKVMVYSIFFLDVLQTGFTTQFSWSFCVQNWGNMPVFETSDFAWTASMLPIMAGLIAMIVQLFYARRIWILGGRWFKACAIVIATIAFLQCLCAFIGSIKYDIVGINDTESSEQPYFVVWLSGSFVCDFLIAVCMIIIFAMLKKSSHSKKTDSVLKILIRIVVETAAITCVCAGVELALGAQIGDKTLAHTVPAFVLGKLYSNCLLANLNGRKEIASIYNSDGTGLVLNSFRLIDLFPSRSEHSLDVTAIRIDQVHHVHHDDGKSTLEAVNHDTEKKTELDQEETITKGVVNETFAYKSDPDMIGQ